MWRCGSDPNSKLIIPNKIHASPNAVGINIIRMMGLVHFTIGEIHIPYIEGMEYKGRR